LIAAVNERGFPLRSDALYNFESVIREWERPYTSLGKKRVAYVLVVEMGIQVFDNLVRNL
jgi:hypothetical protein